MSGTLAFDAFATSLALQLWFCGGGIFILDNGKAAEYPSSATAVSLRA